MNIHTPLDIVVISSEISVKAYRQGQSSQPVSIASSQTRRDNSSHFCMQARNLGQSSQPVSIAVALKVSVFFSKRYLLYWKNSKACGNCGKETFIHNDVDSGNA